MRGLVGLERSTLRELRDTQGEHVFDDATLTELERLGRIERFNVDEEGYALRLTELGHLALRLPPEDDLHEGDELPASPCYRCGRVRPLRVVAALSGLHAACARCRRVLGAAAAAARQLSLFPAELASTGPRKSPCNPTTRDRAGPVRGAGAPEPRRATRAAP